jgi:hypothetical protein
LQWVTSQWPALIGKHLKFTLSAQTQEGLPIILPFKDYVFKDPRKWTDPAWQGIVSVTPLDASVKIGTNSFLTTAVVKQHCKTARLMMYSADYPEISWTDTSVIPADDDIGLKRAMTGIFDTWDWVYRYKQLDGDVPFGGSMDVQIVLFNVTNEDDTSIIGNTYTDPNARVLFERFQVHPDAYKNDWATSAWVTAPESTGAASATYSITLANANATCSATSVKLKNGSGTVVATSTAASIAGSTLTFTMDLTTVTTAGAYTAEFTVTLLGHVHPFTKATTLAVPVSYPTQPANTTNYYLPIDSLVIRNGSNTMTGLKNIITNTNDVLVPNDLNGGSSVAPVWNTYRERLVRNQLQSGWTFNAGHTSGDWSYFMTYYEMNEESQHHSLCAMTINGANKYMTNINGHTGIFVYDGAQVANPYTLPNMGQWNSFCVTYSAAAGLLTFYINGSEIGTTLSAADAVTGVEPMHLFNQEIRGYYGTSIFVNRLMASGEVSALSANHLVYWIGKEPVPVAFPYSNNNSLVVNSNNSPTSTQLDAIALLFNPSTNDGTYTYTATGNWLRIHVKFDTAFIPKRVRISNVTLKQLRNLASSNDNNALNETTNDAFTMGWTKLITQDTVEIPSNSMYELELPTNTVSGKVYVLEFSNTWGNVLEFTLRGIRFYTS